MKKRYYLIAACGLIMSISGYLFFIRPELSRLNKLRSDEVIVRENLNVLRTKIENEKIASPSNRTISLNYKDKNGELLSGLLRLAEWSGLHVELATHMNSENRVQIKIQGEYRQLMSFIKLVELQGSTIYIEDFTVKTRADDKQEAVFDLIYVMSRSAQFRLITIRYANNVISPFCTTTNKQVPVISMDYQPLRNYSIGQMKMKGAAKINSDMYALIMLPNGSEEQVKQGDVIGIERLVVNKIGMTEMHAQYPDKKRMTLKMDVT